MNNALIKGFGIAALAAAVAACGGSGNDNDSTGTMSLGLTDAPITNLSKANLNITSVELKPAEGRSVTVQIETEDGKNSLDINLLDFQGGKVAQLFADQELAAGQYQWIRLHLGDDPYVVEASDENQTPIFLFLPSGRQTGLKLNGGFVIPAGGSADFTIDFDVKKSIFNAGNKGPKGRDKYMLKPAHRLVNNVDAGSIVGEVDVINITSQRTDTAQACDYDGSVYVYEGPDVTPTDIDLTNTEIEGPLVAVSVTNEEQASVYSFKASFLPAGDYTIAYSCQFDDNEEFSDLEFIGTQNVTVTANAETTAEIIQ